MKRNAGRNSLRPGLPLGVLSVFFFAVLLYLFRHPETAETGVFTSFILELLVYPPVYAIWKRRYELKFGTVDPSRIPVPHMRGH